MKTSTIVWIVIAVLILGGCAWYYMNTKNGSSAYSNTSGSNAPMQPAASSTNNGSASSGPSVDMGVRGSVNQGNYGSAQH